MTIAKHKNVGEGTYVAKVTWRITDKAVSEEEADTGKVWFDTLSDDLQASVDGDKTGVRLVQKVRVNFPFDTMTADELKIVAVEGLRIRINKVLKRVFSPSELVSDGDTLHAIDLAKSAVFDRTPKQSPARVQDNVVNALDSGTLTIETLQSILEAKLAKVQ